MKPLFLLLALLAAGIPLSGLADEPAKDAPPRQQATKEEIQARLAAHTRKKAASAAADKAAADAAAAALKAEDAATAAPVVTAKDGTAKPNATDPAKPVAEPAQMLPRVDVKNGRVTELDVQLAKQNAEIAREKQNIKPTKLDEALNGSKISTALAIFGGQSSDDRSNVAKERVAMMEEEKGIIEAIAQAKTKEEKAELEKLLADMKSTRRELEQSLR